MKVVRKLFVTCVLAFSIQHSFAFAQMDTLALVSGVPITSADFVNRWELLIYPGKDNRRMLDSTKIRFLYSLIAEQLLARAPVSIGTAADSTLEIMRKETKEMFMRDALFRREVMNKIVITRHDIEEAIRFSAYDYVIDAFRFPDSTDALHFLRKFRNSDSTRIYAALAASGIVHDTLSVSFGDLQEDVERSFFGRQRGFMSNPVRSKGAYAVIRILSRSTSKKFASMPPQDRLTSLKKTIEERRMDADGWKYLVDVMHTIRVEVISGPFDAMVGEIQGILKKHTLTERAREYHLTSTECEDLQARLAGRLDETLLRFPDQSMTVQEAITALPYSEFAPRDTTATSIERSLRAALRFASQNHYLVERARELGLEQDPEVQSDVQMFVDANRAAEVAATIRAGVRVTQAERDSFYAVRRDTILKDVRLLLRIGAVNTISEAAGLLERLQTADVREVKPPLDTTQVVTRWVLGSEIGEYGAVLARLSPGDVYGPINRPQGYTVFQLLDKKTSVADSSLAQSLEQTERKLLDEKRAIVLDQYIAKLAGQAGMRIYRAKVAATSVQPSQIYTIRYIGFGGRVNAVPMLPPRESWIRFVGREVQIFP